MTKPLSIAAIALSLSLVACNDEPAELPPAATSPTSTAGTTQATDSKDEARPAVPSVPALVHDSWVKGEWLKADNRESCAPIAFGAVADRGGTPRPANFAGGWAVAFDLPDKRSAYGVAGVGVDTKSTEELRRQWPLTTVPQQLPQGSFAGYGFEGAAEYPVDDPDGNSVNSLAYLRVEGQDCLYNVWSNLGRAHLEVMLDSLRLVETGG